MRSSRGSSQEVIGCRVRLLYDTREWHCGYRSLQPSSPASVEAKRLRLSMILPHSTIHLIFLLRILMSPLRHRSQRTHPRPPPVVPNTTHVLFLTRRMLCTTSRNTIVLVLGEMMCSDMRWAAMGSGGSSATTDSAMSLSSVAFNPSFSSSAPF